MRSIAELAATRQSDQPRDRAGLSMAVVPLLPARHWMHSEMWWPRLLKQHADIAWDDYEKDYSDLPEEVLQRHRWAQRLGGWRRGAAAEVACRRQRGGHELT